MAKKVVIRELEISMPSGATGEDMARALRAKFESILQQVPESEHAVLRERFGALEAQCRGLSAEQTSAMTIADALSARAGGVHDLAEAISGLGAHLSKVGLAPHQFFLLGQAMADVGTAALCLRCAADKVREALCVPEFTAEVPDDADVN